MMRQMQGYGKKYAKIKKFTGGRDYHYSWDLNDSGSGFIVYKRKRNRYIMYEDTNGNGIPNYLDVNDTGTLDN